MHQVPSHSWTDNDKALSLSHNDADAATSLLQSAPAVPAKLIPQTPDRAGAGHPVCS